MPGPAGPEPLYVFNGGFLTQRRTRRILELAGYRVTLGAPPEGGLIGIWGQSPTAHRGEKVADWRGAKILRVEDAFLRSVRPGRAGDPPMGLILDDQGVHFDPSSPSKLETILATNPLDDFPLLERARAGIERLQAGEISKYNTHDMAAEPPAPGYVLVIDQTFGDASVTASGADRETFAEMLAHARIENQGSRIYIKTHPETQAGFRKGYYTDDDLGANVEFLTDPIPPYELLSGATVVYTVSSQLGFEAIFAGHRPKVYGQPFYAGWGLTDDKSPVERRKRVLTRAQLFAGAMLLAPTWYDPCRDRLCSFEEALSQLEAEVRCWREDRHGDVATGMRLWKRRHLQEFFGRHRPLKFDDRAPLEHARREGRGILVWASKAGDLPERAKAEGVALARVEDGFLRSRGLGAELVPPLSLVADDLGIYYDPGQESRLEWLIWQASQAKPSALNRAEELIRQIVDGGVSKYAPAASSAPDLPEGLRILVPGQVEDDASILAACPAERTNMDLLRRVRAENPEAVLIYKPHPDVEAGLRPGAMSDDDLKGLADVVARHAAPIPLIDAVDEVWTMTSLLGFEALLRGRKVTCLGLPFYAGWGLTRDLATLPARRTARPSLAALVHATLIEYPRYRDPLSGLPCPPEVIVDRLASGDMMPSGFGLRLLSKLQGVFASYAHLWRR